MRGERNEIKEIISPTQDQHLSDHMASLRYAGMIQHALMHKPEQLKGYMKDYFIIFFPRDIVSGDFYYVFNNKKIMCIAIGDCTGHGVPGALMSILGISFLNEILQSDESLKANRILNVMREKVMKALNQTGTYAETKDSIDIALCKVDLSTGSFQYSGANRPLLMVRNGVLTEFKPDKMTIGLAAFQEAPFTNIFVDTLPGDSFYLFSDGYADQFGGIADKKFKHKRFKRLIESVAGLPMAQQKEQISDAFNEWKGNAQQVDDVLVFGFQL
jgi:serine phosphatase RsbU (regulator of sigma subunit)